MLQDIIETGGFLVTLARDVDPDDSIGGRLLYDWNALHPETNQPRYDRLQSAEDALRSISPYAQVWVPWRWGNAEVRDMDHPSCRLTVEDLIE